MKTLIIKQLEKKLGNPELMIGTDVLKITLSLVRYINKHQYLPTKGKKVVHGWCESVARWVMSVSEYPISKTYYPYDLRLRLGHSELVNEWMELASLNLLMYEFLRPHYISFKASIQSSGPHHLEYSIMFNLLKNKLS